MSSTSRGGKRSDADNYATPAWCVRRLLEAVELPGGAWLEPAAGDGVIIKTAQSCRSDVTWGAVEIRPECKDLLVPLLGRRFLIDNFLTAPLSEHYAVTITNPPFRLAYDFLQRMRTISDWTVLLLRLNFLGGDARSMFMREHVPDVYVLPNRPSFRSPDAVPGQGKWQTDSIEYAWMVWRQEPRSSGIVCILATTPLAERRT